MEAVEEVEVEQEREVVEQEVVAVEEEEAAVAEEEEEEEGEAHQAGHPQRLAIPVARPG